MQFLIREETTDDFAAIRSVNVAAFQQNDEADLVDALRTDGDVILSLVAEEGSNIVGHILFSRMQIVSESATTEAVALAPMAVLPEKQSQGIGSKLIEKGIELLKKDGHRIVIVLGHPKYYPRFGFLPKLTEKLQAPFSGDTFMAMELVSHALRGIEGKVAYPKAFGLD